MEIAASLKQALAVLSIREIRGTARANKTGKGDLRSSIFLRIPLASADVALAAFRRSFDSCR